MNVRFDQVKSIFPEMLVIPQFEIEDVLHQRYRALGGKIEYDAEVLGLQQAENCVSVCIRQQGQERWIKVAYLVGADGHRSVVRNALNVEFAGSCVLPSVIIGDTRIKNPSIEPLTLIANAQGFVFIAPFGDGYYRVLGWDPDLTPYDDETDDFVRLHRIINKVLGKNIGLHDPRWLSRFSSHERIAAQYRQGRVFLVGDAAHVHSPAGGLGMNLGIQDAINLGWKLGAVLHQKSSERLLESYEREMRPLGLKALKESGRLIREATGRRGIVAAIKDAIFTGASKFSPIREMIEYGLGSSISGSNSIMRVEECVPIHSDRHIGTFAFELMRNDSVLNALRQHKYVAVFPKDCSYRACPDVKNLDHVCIELDYEFRGSNSSLETGCRL